MSPSSVLYVITTLHAQWKETKRYSLDQRLQTIASSSPLPRCVLCCESRPETFSLSTHVIGIIVEGPLPSMQVATFALAEKSLARSYIVRVHRAIHSVDQPSSN